MVKFGITSEWIFTMLASFYNKLLQCVDNILMPHTFQIYPLSKPLYSFYRESPQISNHNVLFKQWTNKFQKILAVWLFTSIDRIFWRRRSTKVLLLERLSGPLTQPHFISLRLTLWTSFPFPCWTLAAWLPEGSYQCLLSAQKNLVADLAAMR